MIILTVAVKVSIDDGDDGDDAHPKGKCFGHELGIGMAVSKMQAGNGGEIIQELQETE